MNWKTWDSFVECIKDNAVSLEVFDKVRSLNFRASLARVLNQLPIEAQEVFHRKQKTSPLVQPGLPHAYVVAATMEPVYQPRFYGTPQINIDSNIHKAASFALTSNPDRWPEHLDYPGDPTSRLPEEKRCKSCPEMDDLGADSGQRANIAVHTLFLTRNACFVHYLLESQTTLSR